MNKFWLCLVALSDSSNQSPYGIRKPQPTLEEKLCKLKIQITITFYLIILLNSNYKKTLFFNFHNHLKNE